MTLCWADSTGSYRVWSCDSIRFYVSVTVHDVHFLPGWDTFPAAAWQPAEEATWPLLLLWWHVHNVTMAEQKQEMDFPKQIWKKLRGKVHKLWKWYSLKKKKSNSCLYQFESSLWEGWRCPSELTRQLMLNPIVWEYAAGAVLCSQGIA